MRILFILFALLIAGGVTWWVSGQLKQEDVRQVVQVERPTKSEAVTGVLVASKNLSVGSIIKANDLSYKSWPDSTVRANENFITSRSGKVPADLAGSVVRADVLQGQPILAKMLIQPGDQGFLAAVLRPGMRAISVPVNLRTGVNNLVVPGDFVDLILTTTFQEPYLEPNADGGIDKKSRNVQVAETIIKNARVLAIGSFLSKPADDDTETAQARQKTKIETITVELTPKLSEALALANEMGRITVALAPLVTENPELEGMTDLNAPPYLIQSIADEGYESISLDTQISKAKEQSGKNKSNGAGIVIVRGGSNKDSKVVNTILQEVQE